MQISLDRRSFLRSLSYATLGCNFTRVANAAAAPARPMWIQGVGPREVTTIRSHVDQFMDKHGVPGLSLAMTYAGKLKLLVCAGHADQANDVAVTPQHRFRVASVSKPITSILVMMLRQQGYLNVDQPIFRGILSFPQEVAKLGRENQQRLEQLTTRHLLEHTAGGWSNKSKDPMFTPEALSLDHDALIRWTLSNRPLDYAPGQQYAYSNFGYCLIGRVIEKTVRMDYEAALRAYVLEPFGMKQLSMKLGGNTLAERQDREVVYYGQNEDPYNKYMNVRRMDAHGGWVASPTDLVALANRVDGFASPSDLLNTSSIRYMTATSSANPNYAKGWSVNRANNWWHTGSFNGGSSILARIHDNHCWAMVMNTRSKEAGYSADLDGLPWKIKQSVTAWGGHDLF